MKEFFTIKIQGVTYEVHVDDVYMLHGFLSKIATGKMGEIRNDC